MSSLYQNPYVDENNKFKPGVCPNVDTLKTIVNKGLVSGEVCQEYCAVSIDECNQTYNTGVSLRKCGAICEKDRSSSELAPLIGIQPHTNTCRAGQYCKECCVGRCLIDDKTLNMTCFLNCIDDVCTERISPQPPTAPPTTPTPPAVSSSQPSSKPDILIPVTLTTEEPEKQKTQESEGIWVYLLVIVGLIFLGLGIYVVRRSAIKLPKSMGRK